MSYNRMASKQIKFLPSQLIHQPMEQSGTPLSGGSRTKAKMESAAPGMGMSGQSMGATPEGILMEHAVAPAADKVGGEFEKKLGLSKAEIAEAGELPSYMGGIARRSLKDQKEKEEEQERQDASAGSPSLGAGDALFGF